MKEFNKIPSEYMMNYLGHGFNASVYKLDEENVFKKFNYRGKFEESCKELMKLNSDTFVFPKELVYENHIFVGYIMDYIKGKTLNKINENENIYDFINQVKKCEYDVSTLSIYKYYIIDFKEENIMYTDDKQLKVIDTDYYYKSNNKELFKDNLASYSVACLMPLMNVYKYNFKDDRLNHIKRLLIEGRVKPSSYYMEVLSALSHEVSTFKEAREELKLILK